MEKIDIVIALLFLMIALQVISALARVHKGYSRTGEKLHELIDTARNRGEYQLAYDLCLKHIKKRPGDVYLVWQKAVALYKLNRLEESKEAFTYLSDADPLWKEDARKYIEEIEKKT